MINFELKSIDKIIPAGQEPDLSLSWFWLTDGELWLRFGDTIIYEYSKEALAHFGDKATPYNDYYLVRFIEDFTDLFVQISESVPARFYSITANLEDFHITAKKWLDLYDTDEDEHSEFYFETYDKLISWAYQRYLDSMHLIGGPHLSFFRHHDKIRIVWQTEATLENGIRIWTAQSGSYEMDYAVFIENVKEFGRQFFLAMDKQVEQTIEKEWGHIQVDKKRLAAEHEERKADFYSKLSQLEQSSTAPTNWVAIEALYTLMLTEVK
jgi:hypothetical protein